MTSDRRRIHHQVDPGLSIELTITGEPTSAFWEALDVIAREAYARLLGEVGGRAAQEGKAARPSASSACPADSLRPS